MAGRKVEVWSRLIAATKELSELTGIKVPKELSVQSGDFWTRNLNRLEIVADLLEEANKVIRKLKSTKGASSEEKVGAKKGADKKAAVSKQPVVSPEAEEPETAVETPPAEE